MLVRVWHYLDKSLAVRSSLSLRWISAQMQGYRGGLVDGGVSSGLRGLVGLISPPFKLFSSAIKFVLCQDRQLLSLFGVSALRN